MSAAPNTAPPAADSKKKDGPAEGTPSWFKDKLLEKSKGLQEMATEYLTAERCIFLTLGLMLKTPGLLDCTFPSVLQCVGDATALGLEPGKDIHFIPRDNKYFDAQNRPYYLTECSSIVDYKGLIRVAYRSPIVGKIEAKPVFEGDLFEYCEGDRPSMTHVPDLRVPRTGSTVMAAYAIVTLNTGHQLRHVMTRAEIECVRAMSKGANSSLWKDEHNYVEACRKTVVRNIFKFIPFPSIVHQAIERIDATEYDFGGRVVSDQEARPAAAGALPPKSGNAAAEKLMQDIHNSRSQPKAAATATRPTVAATKPQEPPAPRPATRPSQPAPVAQAKPAPVAQAKPAAPQRASQPLGRRTEISDADLADMDRRATDTNQPPPTSPRGQHGRRDHSREELPPIDEADIPFGSPPPRSRPVHKDRAPCS